MSLDSAYNNDWQEWLMIVQKQLGLVDLADLIYGRSEDFVEYRKRGPESGARHLRKRAFGSATEC
jgi:hypothetical protein